MHGFSADPCAFFARPDRRSFYRTAWPARFNSFTRS
jgi:hypothetical protein